MINNIDKLIIGGAALHEQFVRELNQYQCQCYAAYGMTESISHVALRTLNGRDASELFTALPGVEVAADERGCLLVKAPYLAEHLATNDIVEVVNNRQFRWLGRWDNVINTGGYKVLPERLEAAVQSLFNSAGICNRFFIHGVEDKKLGHRIALVIEAVGNDVDLIGRTLPSLASELNPYELPKELLISPSFQLTETRKINRAETVKSVIQRISQK